MKSLILFVFLVMSTPAWAQLCWWDGCDRLRAEWEARRRVEAMEAREYEMRAAQRNAEWQAQFRHMQAMDVLRRQQEAMQDMHNRLIIQEWQNRR